MMNLFVVISANLKMVIAVFISKIQMEQNYFGKRISLSLDLHI